MSERRCRQRLGRPCGSGQGSGRSGPARSWRTGRPRRGRLGGKGCIRMFKGRGGDWQGQGARGPAWEARRPPAGDISRERAGRRISRNASSLSAASRWPPAQHVVAPTCEALVKDSVAADVWGVEHAHHSDVAGQQRDLRLTLGKAGAGGPPVRWRRLLQGGAGGSRWCKREVA